MKTFKQYFEETTEPKSSIRDIGVYPVLRKYRSLMERANDPEINMLFLYIDILRTHYKILKDNRISMAINYFEHIIFSYICDIYFREYLKRDMYIKESFNEVLHKNPIKNNLTTHDEIMKEFERIYNPNSSIRISAYHVSIAIDVEFGVETTPFQNFLPIIKNGKREWIKIKK